MRTIHVLWILAASLFVLYGCPQDDPPFIDPCEDGIQNFGESGIDCGGDCCPCPVDIEWSAYTEWENPRTHMETALVGDRLYISGGGYAIDWNWPILES